MNKLGKLIIRRRIMAFEFEFLHALEGLRNPVLDAIMLFITRLGDNNIVWHIFCWTLILLPARKKYHEKDYDDEYEAKIKKRRKLGWAILVAEIFSMIIVSYVLKTVVGRPRPFYVDSTLFVNRNQIAVMLPSRTSFPSGHTSAAFAAAFASLFAYKKKAIPVLIFACLMAFSRMYFFVHYPTDILGGIVTGFISAKLATVFSEYMA